MLQTEITNTRLGLGNMEKLFTEKHCKRTGASHRPGISDKTSSRSNWSRIGILAKDKVSMRPDKQLESS